MKELIFPKGLDLDRPKRARTTFSDIQIRVLEEEFQRNQYLVGRDRIDLAHRLGLTEIQVRNSTLYQIKILYRMLTLLRDHLVPSVSC